jgi:hypothetical protein
VAVDDERPNLVSGQNALLAIFREHERIRENPFSKHRTPFPKFLWFQANRPTNKSTDARSVGGRASASTSAEGANARSAQGEGEVG